MTSGHAAINGTARDRTANCSGCSSKKPVADQAMTHHRAGNSAHDRSCRR
jgi:hypothetical protein